MKDLMKDERLKTVKDPSHEACSILQAKPKTMIAKNP
jgi:hypothetical protein